MNELDRLFKYVGQYIRVYVAQETTNDPNYDDKTKTMLNSFPVKAIVQDLGYASAKWRLPGIESGGVKEITCEKRHKSLIEKSQKIQIDSEYYYGFKPANGNRMQIKEAGNYIIVLLTTEETL